MRARLAALVVYAAAAVLLCAGWRLFWFLTDDAYIAFRYVHNVSLGRGLVWNPAPFLPVEGYTSFAWVVLLCGIERVFGTAPDIAANRLGLGLGLVELGIIVPVLFRCSVPERWRRQRVLLAAITLGGLLSNRTYLTWHSSGLETPLFNVELTAWLALLVWPWPERARRRLTALCAVAALLALTRPDGMLFALTSLAFVVLQVALSRQASSLTALLPLGTVALHVAWRLSFYGQFWPNTYYAKYSQAWPESGWRYAACFVLEYGLYVPLLLAAWLAWARRGPLRLAWLTDPRVVAVAAVALHLGSITLLIGGDHFEYRPYSYVVPWLWLGALWLAGQAFESVRPALGFLTASWLASLPIPWLHFQHTRGLETRARTHYLHFRVAPLLPQPLAAIAALWDDWQGWLIAHYVCLRHQEHKIFLRHQFEFWAPAERGKKLDWREHDVLFATSVGVPGWVFPNVAILDLLGLNDVVVAHSRVGESGFRRMAHDRWPPPGYVRCFQPNVEGFRASFRVLPRPLSADAIRGCEQRFRSALPKLAAP